MRFRTPPALGLSTCSQRQVAAGYIPPSAQIANVSEQTHDGAASSRLKPNSSGILEIPVDATYTYQIASDLAGNEWIAASKPSAGMLLRSNEQTKAVSDFDLPASAGNPLAIALGKHHNSMWFTSLNKHVIGYMKLSQHTVTEFTLPTHNAVSYGIVAGPDNAMWFSEYRSDTGTGKIGRIDLANFTITEYPLPAHAEPDQITPGTDGALWFTDYSGAIGRITTSGQIADYTIGASTPTGITTGLDGAIWFTGRSNVQGPFVGRIDLTTHTPKLYKYSAGSGWNEGIVSRDSSLWMTAYDKGSIDRFDLSTHAIHRRALSGFSVPTASRSAPTITCGLPTKGRMARQSVSCAPISIPTNALPDPRLLGRGSA